MRAELETVDLAHGGTHSELVREYLATLLSRDKHRAVRLIMDEAERGTPVRDLYLNIFQPAQREIGRLWQTNKVTVAQEHFCTATTQLIMSQLYPYVFNQKRNGKSVVVACVGGELHEVGARMVADLFEMDGWDSYFLGANTPTDSILSAIADHEADLLALSVTINFNIPAATRLVREIRASSDATDLKLMVGGRPFLVAPTLWETVGADGFATDAALATKTALDLVAG